MRFDPGRKVRPLFIVLVLLFGVLPGGEAALAQSDGDATEARVAQVTRTVELLGSLEMSSDLHQLYDRLHPDVREVLSRGGWGSFYRSAEALIPAEPVEVVSVDFEPWTWPVTGEEYDEAAVVTVLMRADQGDRAVETRRELHLVEDDDTWRWFIGGDETFLDEQDARAANDAAYQSPFEDDRYADIDRFWAAAFAAVGLDYRSPDDIVTLDAPAATGCGFEADVDEVSVFYCTLDDTMYYNPAFRNDVEDVAGDYAWYHIIAHEWGHHIQNQLGIDASLEPELDGGLYPIELELQADCLAGTYAQDAFAREEIGTEQVEQAIDITDVSGDMGSTEWDDPTAHGSGRQRRVSMLTGYEDGFLGCNLDLLIAAG